jgi:hypothetical protein
MPRVSAAFFTVGVLCVLLGMAWGMDMGASNNLVEMPAHAHLNLVGWATMSLYGTFYALTKDTMAPRLAWLNFIVSLVGLVVMIPALALMLISGPKFLPGVMAGSIITFIGALIFLISVLRELFRRRA